MGPMEMTMQQVTRVERSEVREVLGWHLALGVIVGVVLGAMVRGKR